MTRARYQQVSLQDTPYYHCISRCVRRAYLCGDDPVSGKNFDHRKQWLVTRIKQLAAQFAIEICAYAIMGNHYHLVLHVNQEQADAWSDDEVINRWTELFPRNAALIETLRNNKSNRAAQKHLKQHVNLWRERLMDISWFMRVLNEGIARRANAEDQCTGRFWEGRFKCQALLDDAALMACMAYVDLNPIRAKMANTPESSAYTSVRKRIQKARSTHAPNHPQQQMSGLFPFVGYPRTEMPKGLPFRLTDYLELVELGGRIFRDDNRGAIDALASPILERLNMEPKHWAYLIQHFESCFKSLVGAAYKLKQVCQSLGYQRTPGIKNCAVYFP